MLKNKDGLEIINKYIISALDEVGKGYEEKRYICRAFSHLQKRQKMPLLQYPTVPRRQKAAAIRFCLQRLITQRKCSEGNYIVYFLIVLCLKRNVF